MAGAPKYKKPEEMEEKIKAYFASLDGEMLLDGDGEPVVAKNGEIVWKRKPRPPTQPGILDALGFTSRQTLLNYKDRSEGFQRVIDEAMLKIEMYAAERLYERDAYKGAAFTLTCNFKWRTDEQEADGERGVVLIDDIPR